VIQDLRYALRQLKKNPGFATIAVLTLALGIAAVTTVFTWANAVLFNPWPQVRAANEIRTLSVIVLVSTAAFAAWLPARRAAAIEPMQALRAE
jgi:ABC-type antimicrobial peptide transport system permease subunit